MLREESILGLCTEVLIAKHKVYWKEHGCLYEKTIGGNFEKVNIICTGVYYRCTYCFLCGYKDFAE